MSFNFTFNNFNSDENKLYVEYIPTFNFSEDTETVIPITFAKDNEELDFLKLKTIFDGEGKLYFSTLPSCFLKVEETVLIEDRKNKDYTVYSVAFKIDGYIYLESGEDIIEVTDSIYLMNNYRESLPQIKAWLHGSGSIIINGEVIQLRNINEYVIIDSEVQDCYDNLGFLNNNVDLEHFPVLQKGENKIQLSNVTKIEIIPRWRV